jgi:tetratricopeptide (TPR) repeat protein
MHSDWQLDPRHSGSFARLETLLGKLHGFHALIVQHNNPVYRDGLIRCLQALQSGNDTLDLKPLDGFEAFETALTGLAGKVATLHVVNLESWDETLRQAFFRGINYHREYLAHQLNATLVLWLVEPHIRDMALQAADFWAWREQVLDFALPLEHPVRWDGDWQKTTNLDQTSKQQRIQEILDFLATQQHKEPTLTLADMQHELGNLYQWLGEYDTAQQHLNAALANFAKLDERHAYARVLMDKAYLRFQQGEPTEALHDLQTKVLPWFIKLNDLKQQAETQSRIADILQARGQLDEALNIRQNEELPVYEKLGDVRSKAVTMGKIADILQARGQLDDALNIRENHELPVYEKLGDVLNKAITMGKIADILQARGQFDDALNTLNETLPVYEKLGDVRELLIGRAKLAMLLWRMDAAANAARVQELLCLALTDARRLQIPEAGIIENILSQMGLSCDK